MMDDKFALIGNVEKRFSNLNSLFITGFQTQALGTLDEYGIKYIVITPSAKEKYQIESFNYLTEECFELIYDEEVQIYLVKCELSKR